jgi:hypothetical protein
VSSLTITTSGTVCEFWIGFAFTLSVREALRLTNCPSLPEAKNAMIGLATLLLPPLFMRTSRIRPSSSPNSFNACSICGGMVSSKKVGMKM